ncbi:MULTISPECIES: LysE family translocator [Thermoleptolyngbya]|nr:MULTISPECIES: LysE family translocator [Thermoleptolyngbya]
MFPTLAQTWTQSNLTLSNIVALFSAMVVLAAIPSISVLTVSTRAASLGFLHGVLTAAGIVVGDLLFIAIALWGLSFLSSALGSLVFLIKYLGGAYLIWLGLRLFRAREQPVEAQSISHSSRVSSFLTGLLITLADQKATLFYLGFFPAFLDMSQVSYVDAGVIMLVAIAAVGGVKVIYALLADQTRFLLGGGLSTRLNAIAGGVMVAVGLLLILTAA